MTPIWHMRLLAQAGRIDELAQLAGSDVHARRQLDRALREAGKADELRHRADNLDRYALLQLKRFLGSKDQTKDIC